MFCKYCGEELKEDEGANFCSSCGKANPAGALAQQSKHTGDKLKNNTAGHSSRLRVLLVTCATISMFGYLFQNCIYVQAICDLEPNRYFSVAASSQFGPVKLFSIWHMLLPVLVGSALVFILHYKGKVADEKINAMAYIVLCAGFFLNYGVGIFAAKVCYWFIGIQATAELYINMVYTGLFGLKFIWPWLMLVCYLISKPVPWSKKNKPLVVGAVIFGCCLLFFFRVPLCQAILESAHLGLHMTPGGELPALTAGVQLLVLLYIARVAGYGKKRNIIAVVLIVFIISNLMIVSLVFWLSLGVRGIYVAELLAYLVGAGILYIISKSSLFRQS